MFQKLLKCIEYFEFDLKSLFRMKFKIREIFVEVELEFYFLFIFGIFW